MHVQTKKKGKQYTFSVMVKPALINSSRYEYASSGLVNISYRNINHSFIGNLSVAGDRNRQAGARGWRKEGERKHTVLWESSKDKGVCSFCVCMRTCLIEIQIGWLVYHSKCVLRLFYTRFGDTAFICRKKLVQYFTLPSALSHTFLICSLQMKTVHPQLLCHMSQLRQKCLLGLFLTVFFCSLTVCPWLQH